MRRRSSKGKGKRLPSPNHSSDEGHDAADQLAVKKLCRSSPERITNAALAKAGTAIAGSSKGLAGFASLVTRASMIAAKSETNTGLKGSSGQVPRTGAGSKAKTVSVYKRYLSFFLMRLFF